MDMAMSDDDVCVGYDCGVFACRFADCAAQDKDFFFSQRDMPLFRNSMVAEVIRSNLRTHPTNGNKK